MEVSNLELKDKVLKAIKVISGDDALRTESKNDTIYFLTESNELYEITHSQDCCEYVYIDDISGNLENLIGYPLIMAEEVYQDASTEEDSSATWTFYKFATIKGYVNIRWYGSSNGYYSEIADIHKIDDNYWDSTAYNYIISNFFDEYEV